jgi:hypothetical protein
VNEQPEASVPDDSAVPDNAPSETVPPNTVPPNTAPENAVPDDGEEIPVVEVTPRSTAPAARSSAPTASGTDWTRTEPVRDDPGTLGEEARKLWDSVREQFVEPLVRNYPEAAGHLTMAGTELAAALRALVRGAEQRWTNGGEERPDDGRDSPQDR